MLKILLFLSTVIVAAQSIRAAPQAPGKAAEAAELQDRIDRRAREIATMTAYSARLERILVRAGFPTDESVRPLSLEQKMDRVFPAGRCNATRFVDALSALSQATKVEISIDWKALAEAGVDQPVPITCNLRNCSARAALQAILSASGGSSVKLIYLLEDGKVKVTTADYAALTRTYDVTAVLPRYPTLREAQDVLGKIVTDTVAPDTWKDAGGTVGSLSFTGVRMTVTQLPVNLAGVESLLEELDVNKQIAHRHATIDQQEIQIVALTREIDKRVARCRSVGIRVPPQLDQAMELVLPDIQFTGWPLATCLDSLGSTSGQLIFVNWNALRAAGIDGRTPITLSLHRQTLAAALQSVIRKTSDGNARLQYDAQDNVIAISTQAEFDKLTVTRVYDIREILPLQGNRQDAADELIRAMTRTIEPDSWQDAGGTLGSVREFQGQLIITHSDRVQAYIRAYLDLLRHQRRLMRASKG